MIGRRDIIGDLARLQREFLGASNEVDDLLHRLELLAATAVEMGMSHNIVAKASGIPRERVDAVLAARPMAVERCATSYERRPNGLVTQRDRSS